MALFELYHMSSIGMALTQTLDEMCDRGLLSPQLCLQVFLQFDQSILETLESQVRSRPVSIEGHLHTYRFCDDVWTFILQDAQITTEQGTEAVDRLKIVAVDAKLLSH